MTVEDRRGTSRKSQRTDETADDILGGRHISATMADDDFVTNDT
jgi:hypothetical protein